LELGSVGGVEVNSRTARIQPKDLKLKDEPTSAFQTSRKAAGCATPRCLQHRPTEAQVQREPSREWPSRANFNETTPRERRSRANFSETTSWTPSQRIWPSAGQRRAAGPRSMRRDSPVSVNLAPVSLKLVAQNSLEGPDSVRQATSSPRARKCSCSSGQVLSLIGIVGWRARLNETPPRERPSRARSSETTSWTVSQPMWSAAGQRGEAGPGLVRRDSARHRWGGWRPRSGGKVGRA
jgi:hypothetical protein